MSRACACTSGRPYDECCGPFHRTEREAPDAETLMRSRFAAFALKMPEYLWRTLHPTHEDRARPPADVIAELRKATATMRFMGLQILDRAAPDADGVARVLFRARVFERGRDRSFAEASDFLHDGTGWRYVGGSAQRVEDLDTASGAWTLERFFAALRLK